MIKKAERICQNKPSPVALMPEKGRQRSAKALQKGTKLMQKRSQISQNDAQGQK